MANEQVGTGNAQDTVTVAGALRVVGQPVFGGVTVAPTKPTIATVPVTSTTGDVAAIGTAVNALRLALVNLGLAQ